MEIVGKAFAAVAFPAYLETLRWEAWKPTGITIHHCAAPSLAQRPKGFARAHMENLAYYYGARLGWATGPHLFVDEDEIWVFTPLTVRGTHAHSFNRTDIGIEMLGNFDVEDPWSGRGLAVLETTAAAVVALQRRLPEIGVVRFHRDDPRTDKTCPGTRLEKERFLRLVEVIRRHTT